MRIQISLRLNYAMKWGQDMSTSYIRGKKVTE